MKLTNDEMLKLQQNLKVGKCPNCGYEGDKVIGLHTVNLISLKTEGTEIIETEKLNSLPAVLTSCPKCGYISLFDGTIKYFV